MACDSDVSFRRLHFQQFTIFALQRYPHAMSNADLMPLINEDIESSIAQMEVRLSGDSPPPSVEQSLWRRSPNQVEENPRIMIIDDEPINVKVARKYLEREGYLEFVTTTEPEKAFDLILEKLPDVILLDIMMPQVSGLQMLEQIRRDDRTNDLPVIILTASTDKQTKLDALNLGATDFLNKPVDPTELAPRVRNALCVKAHQDHLANYAWEMELEVSTRTAALKAAQDELIHSLARAAEYRDDETGQHIKRVGRYAEVIARELGLAENFVRLIADAAPLHDIGKIGIPDSILLKPGKLEPDEWEQMRKHCGFGKRIVESPVSQEEMATFRTHTDQGARLLTGSSSPVLRVAARIALTHHERWDGSGYPIGLAGNDIPLEGRIVAVADVFDALSSKRPYKPAYPLDKCFEIMEEQRAKHFDPKVLDAFVARREDIVKIQCALADCE
ncbi:MAG: response regulator [Planctomycetales bacterium]|nr:response regulator [Planctomycetales bacterium]